MSVPMLLSWCPGQTPPAKCDPCKPVPPGGPWPTTPPGNVVEVGVYAIQIGIDPLTGIPNAGGGGNTLIGMGAFFIGDPTNPYVHLPTPLEWSYGPTPIDSPSLDGVYYFVFLSYGGANYAIGGDSGTGTGQYSSLADGVNAALQFQTYWWGWG